MYAARAPYRKKSYHSKSVPSAEAPMTCAVPERASGIPEEDRQLARDTVDLAAEALERAGRDVGAPVPGRVVAHVEFRERRVEVALCPDPAPELGEALAPLLQPEVHPVRLVAQEEADVRFHRLAVVERDLVGRR